MCIGRDGIIACIRHGSAVRQAACHARREAGCRVGRHVAAGRRVGDRGGPHVAAGDNAVPRCAPGIGGVWIVRPAVVGHPVQRVLQVCGHGGSEADDEDPVARVGQCLGAGDGFPPVLVPVGVTLLAVTAARVRVRSVGHEDDEFLTAGRCAVRRLVCVQIGPRFAQRGCQRGPSVCAGPADGV